MASIYTYILKIHNSKSISSPFVTENKDLYLVKSWEVCGTPYAKYIIFLKACGVCGRTLQGPWEVCGTPYANF